MTPVAITTLLDVYCRPCVELNQEGLKQCSGLIESDPVDATMRDPLSHGYRLTKHGSAMVSALIAMPLPTHHECWRVKYVHEFVPGQ